MFEEEAIEQKPEIRNIRSFWNFFDEYENIANNGFPPEVKQMRNAFNQLELKDLYPNYTQEEDIDSKTRNIINDVAGNLALVRKLCGHLLIEKPFCECPLINKHHTVIETIEESSKLFKAMGREDALDLSDKINTYLNRDRHLFISSQIISGSTLNEGDNYIYLYEACRDMIKMSGGLWIAIWSNRRDLNGINPGFKWSLWFCDQLNHLKIEVNKRYGVMA
jgi:hypothetical protein